MPIYEYDCQGCGKRLEVLIRTDKDVPTSCPDCKSSKIVKAFSSFAVTSAPSATAACDSCPSVESGCASAGCSTGQCPYS